MDHEDRDLPVLREVPVREWYLRDPDGVVHLNASRGGTKITWCEEQEFHGNGQYWESYVLELVKHTKGLVPTCLSCLGHT